MKGESYASQWGPASGSYLCEAYKKCKDTLRDCTQSGKVDKVHQPLVAKSECATLILGWVTNKLLIAFCSGNLVYDADVQDMASLALCR